MLSGLFQRGAGEKKCARTGVAGIAGAKLIERFAGHPAGDYGLPGFADGTFAAAQAAGAGLQRPLKRFDSDPQRGNGAATGDCDGGFVHGSVHRGSQALRRSSMNAGQFKISSPAKVVNTWLVPPVASKAPSLARRTS